MIDTRPPAEIDDLLMHWDKIPFVTHHYRSRGFGSTS